MRLCIGGQLAFDWMGGEGDDWSVLKKGCMRRGLKEVEWDITEVTLCMGCLG